MPRRATLLTVLPSFALGTVATLLLSGVLPQLKAQWFTEPCPAGPTAVAGDPAGCKPDFHRAQQVSGVMTSARNLAVFCTSSALGRLSDGYGRVPLLHLGNVAAALPVLGLLATRGESAAAYYALFLLAGFFSSGLYQFVAYVADVAEPSQRPRQFAVLGATVGVGLVASPFLATFATSPEQLFVASFALLAANQLLLFFVPESLAPERRKPVEGVHCCEPSADGLSEGVGDAAGADSSAREPLLSGRGDADGAPTPLPTPSAARARPPLVRSTSVNPFRQLLSVRTHGSRTMVWLVVYVFLGSLAETGCAEIALLYMNDMLGITKGDDIKAFSSTYFAATGVGMVASQLVLINALLALRASPAVMLTLSSVANGMHQLVYASLRAVPSRELAFANILFTSVMFVGTPAVNAALSRVTAHDEQGISLGTLDAVRSLVGALGPALFSELYSLGGSHARGVPELPFFVGAALAFGSLVVVWGPLRHELSAGAVVGAAGEAAALGKPAPLQTSTQEELGTGEGQSQQGGDGGGDGDAALGLAADVERGAAMEAAREVVNEEPLL